MSKGTWSPFISCPLPISHCSREVEEGSERGSEDDECMEDEEGHNYKGDDDDSNDDDTMEVNSEGMEGMYDLMFGVDHSDDDSGDDDDSNRNVSHDEDDEESSSNGGEEEEGEEGGHNYDGEEVDLDDTDSAAMVIEPIHSDTDDFSANTASSNDGDNDTDASPNQPDLPLPLPNPTPSHTIESTDTTSSNVDLTHTSPTVTANKTLSSDTIYNIVTPNPTASASTTTIPIPTTTAEVTYTPQHAITALAEAAHTVLFKRLVEELYHACLKNIVAAFILVSFVSLINCLLRHNICYIVYMYDVSQYV